LEQRLQCLGCHYVKYSEQVESELTLQAPVPSNAEAGTQVALQDCLNVFFADHEIDGLHCPVCNKNTTHRQTKRFKTFPRHLVVVLQRFVLDNWVPKKLEVLLQLDSQYDFDLYKSKGL
jgi:ubiquitin carboxyl-terminal hydrolase 5/13